MALTVTLAYPLSREYLPGKRYVSAFVVFTMLFSGGMIPTYDDNPDIVKRIMAEIEACRADIGDTFTGMAGINVRPAGTVKEPRPLTCCREDYPYIIPMYDKVEAG